MTEEIKSAAGHTVIGKVVSSKMHKTIVVERVWKVKHKLYGKYINRSSRMYAHDEENVSKLGDIVEIKSCRPLSKTKHYVLVKVVEQIGTDPIE